jgi:hypothetical protein
VGIDANEITDQVAREGFSQPPIGTEATLGISVNVNRNWTAGNMGSTGSPNLDKGRLRDILKKLYVKRTGELLSLTRCQIRIMTGLLRGHS